ncbi:MAG: flagellar basal body P-ring formation protein FlgA [Alphaproteobacteria bacterium]|nr:flagellar basal body P-ring formation protein FlgA [Alphaproteobacteria bacterium]
MIRVATLASVLALMCSAAAVAAESTTVKTVQVPAATPFFGDRFSGGRDLPVAAGVRAVVAVAAPVEREGAAAAPALRAEATIASDIVRIGDLIDNAGAVAEMPIFRAPDLGQVGSVPASRVIEAVRMHLTVALDTRGIAEVVVRRSSRAITAKDIEARLLRALAGQQGLADAANLTVTFDNEVRTLQVETGANAELQVARLTFEPRNGRFDVAFELPGSAAARKLPLRFTGSIAETFEALVPTRPLAQGDVLKAGDLTVVRRPKAEYAPNVIVDAERAIGLTPRRALRPGQVIRQSDVAKPEVVARNETVTISYEVPGILLTIRGQAQEAGAQGDLINVVNVQTKRTIQATITGPGRVSVAAASARLANAAPTLPSNSAR